MKYEVKVAERRNYDVVYIVEAKNEAEAEHKAREGEVGQEKSSEFRGTISIQPFEVKPLCPICGQPKG